MKAVVSRAVCFMRVSVRRASSSSLLSLTMMNVSTTNGTYTCTMNDLLIKACCLLSFLPFLVVR